MNSPSSTPSRAELAKTAVKYRRLVRLISFLDRRLSFPFPPSANLNISIPSTLSKTPGQIQLYFYTAPGRDLSPDTETQDAASQRPLLINFHGGGFTLGHAFDDARWFRDVLQTYPDAVVVSVGYRLAPEYPYPTAIEDCVDALLWLWDNAEQYDFDRNRFVLSGGSAGGNLAFTVPFMLYNERMKQKQRQNQGEKKPSTHSSQSTDLESKLAGIIAFYPSTNWTQTRDERNATNPIALQKSPIKPHVYQLFDDSYLFAESLPKRPDTDEIDMSHPYLSPGLAPTPLLLAAYPSNVAIYTCGWDQLLAEGDAFRDRLRQLAVDGQMKHVSGMVMEDVVHGFDKRPSFILGNKIRDRMYGDAVRQLGVMWDGK